MEITTIHTNLSSNNAKAVTAISQMAIAAGHDHPLEWLPYYLNLPMRLYDYDDSETYEKADELVLAFDAFKDFFQGTALDEDDPKMQMTNLDFWEMTENHFRENSLEMGRQAHTLLQGWAYAVGEDDSQDEEFDPTE